MRIFRHIVSLTAAVLAVCAAASGQEKIGNSIEIDRMVHNFGDIIHKSGPVSCSFTLKNIADKPVVIYNVVSTCGCTDVEWTREPIRPGQEGKVSVTYSNDEGAYPFDKTLTAYISDINKPVLLKIRGVSIEKAKPLKELYPVGFGPFALRETFIKCGNLEQGGLKSEAVMVANTSSRPIHVSFTDVDENLSISVNPNPIPAEGTAEMSFSVKADRSLWGKNTYRATPVVDGKVYKGSDGKSTIGIWAFTKENFSHLTQDEKAKGPRPTFKESTYSFGKIKRGESVHASFTFKNDGEKPFCVYKINSDALCWSHSRIEVAAPGEEVTFRFHLDTSSLPAGEHLTIVTLTTNSPLRPIVNLFVAGYIE